MKSKYLNLIERIRMVESDFQTKAKKLLCFLLIVSLFFINGCSKLKNSVDRKKIDLLLKKENIYDFFDFIISGENVEKSKPDPEIFVKAKDAFEFSNEECLILEDSYNGYKAAQKSAMDYLIIHDSSFDKFFLLIEKLII